MPKIARKTSRSRPSGSLAWIAKEVRIDPFAWPMFVEHTLIVLHVAVDLALCQLLHGHGCSIAHAEQHRDRDANCFFQRIVFDYSTMHTDMVSLEYGVQEVCTRFRMEFQLNWGSRPKRLCIFVSKYDHVQCRSQLCGARGSTRAPFECDS